MSNEKEDSSYHKSPKERMETSDKNKLYPTPQSKVCDHDWKPAGTITRDHQGQLILQIYCYNCGENRTAQLVFAHSLWKRPGFPHEPFHRGEY